MVHLYIGDGKGKTSSALGLALRFAGCKRKTYIAQFLKDKNFSCSEVEAVKKIPFIKIERFCGQIHPMFLNKKDFDKKKLKNSCDKIIKKIETVIKNKTVDLIILDEILDLLPLKVITVAQIISLIKEAKDVELVLTGRNASESIKKLADYISLVKKIKHPFDKGVTARKGVEY